MSKFFSCFTRGVLLLLIGGIMCLWTSTGDFIVSLKPAQSFEDFLEADPQEDVHVKGNIVYSYDCFASEETWTENRNGSRSAAKTSNYYYAIPGYENILAVEVKTDLSGSMDKLADETFDYLNGGVAPATEIPFEGRVVKMKSELSRYFNEYLEEIGFTEAEITAMGDPLVVERRSFGAVRCIFAAGIVLVILAIIFFIHNLKKKNKAPVVGQDVPLDPTNIVMGSSNDSTANIPNASSEETQSY